MIEDIKSIKEFIVNPTNNLEEIHLFLDRNLRNVIRQIFESLLILLKNYKQNEKKIEDILILLEQLVEDVPDSKLELFVSPILEFQGKVQRTFKLKQRQSFQRFCFRIDELLVHIQDKMSSYELYHQISYLNTLIFQDKKLTMVRHFLKESSNVLDMNFAGEEHIFMKLFKTYLFLEETKQKEIKFFYQVISLFIHSQYGETILKDKNKYLSIIRHSGIGYLEHIIQLIELFDSNFTISLKEIEERYGVSFEFPNVIVQEMLNFELNQKRRFDFTKQECITIDSNNATCLDDALYIEKNQDDTYTLYIHITDIPSFVPFSSLTNEEARKRTETLYLPDTNILLYPDRISNFQCSLLPKQKRNVISYIFRLDSHFELLESHFRVVKGIISCSHKLSYETVDDMILHPTVENTNQMLRQLFCFANKRRSQNKKKDNYRQYENFLQSEEHHESLKLDYSPSANIVHETMILVNYSIAKYFKRLQYPYVYRQIAIPSDDFIEKQLLKIQTLDANIRENKQFLMQLKESYMKAVYSGVPVYHKGLNLECYSHSTSPARRYADAFGQYLIYDFLFLKKHGDFDIYAWEYRVNQLVQYLNEKKKANELFTNQYNELFHKGLIKQKRKS